MLPLTKKIVKNQSIDIYNVLSSNKKSGHSNLQLDEGGKLKKLLDLLWIKLEERVKNMGDAYRFFD